ncbi:carboxypeptidase-like regulatory domain-containing protein [Winogradskyella sp.]|uniref:carboxypeptidase-like regulatory domain-containing protein n=1 Tax=Winogradskyella sp. TaxID=1883156 RepID=UPI0025D5EBAE|nr:carboxypeptidase-like regulatory domain-containing protein [Winogradskyella sp.]
MKTKSLLILFFTLIYSSYSFSQLKILKGSVFATDDVEGIHILNKTSAKYTVTNVEGKFEILAKEHDVLTITSLKYETLEVIVTSKNISNQFLKLYLVERVNELEEVVVGKILTGNIGSDIRNIDIEKELNFYDLGIPGYTGKPKTLNERKLATATSGSGIPLIAIINLITGKTKRLKEIVKLDKKIKCSKKLKSEYSKVIFKNENFSEVLQNRFFDFIMDSEDMERICNSKNVLKPIDFLYDELELFKQRLKSDE